MDTARIINIAVPIVFLGLFYLLLIKPQQKREKEVKQMREALAVGDEVVTIGGFVGKIVKVDEKTVTLEIGADKVRLTVEKWGIGKHYTRD